MGDVIHTLPAAASLKHSIPNSRLTWLIRPRWAPLLEGNPYVDEIISLERSFATSFAEARRLRARHFDLAVDFQRFPDETYQSVLQALESRGYRQDPSQPFRFRREVPVAAGQPIIVVVDLLAGEYGGTGRSSRTQPIQDARARKARGCDLAFEKPEAIQLEGHLPEGGRDSVTLRVAGVVPWLVMKGMALADRVKEKDAYDVYIAVRNYPGGIPALAEAFQEHLAHGLVREGLAKVRRAFLSVDRVGPKWVADFLEISDPEERAIIQRRAYELVTAWLDRLKIEA